MNNLVEPIERRPLDEDERAAYRERFKHSVYLQIRALFEKLSVEEGLTQKEIARRLGINASLVSRRLRGEANLTIDTLCDLARAMDARLEARVRQLADVSLAATVPTDRRNLVRVASDTWVSVPWTCPALVPVEAPVPGVMTRMDYGHWLSNSAFQNAPKKLQGVA